EAGRCGTRARTRSRGARAALCIWDRREWRGADGIPSCRSILGELIAEPMQRLRVAPPIRKHLDPQVEVHARADERFDLATRGPADGANALPTGADEDLLLALPLDVEDRSNVHGRLRLAKLLDLACDAIRHFIVELLERRLANQLC